MKLWDKVKRPPLEALKTIKGGRLSGMTDISPQWRYKILTETFGSCGVGWKFTIDKQWTEQGHNDELFAFVNISLFFKDGETWSEAIPGSGGHKLVVSESKGHHNNDEAFKMATTDALSTAMKMLGVASDIYMGMFDGSKYKDGNNPTPEIQKWTKGTLGKRLAEIKLGFESAGIVNVFNDNLEANYGSKDPVEIVKNHLGKADEIIQGLTVAYKTEVK